MDKNGVFKSREGSDVLILWPPGDGLALVRVDGIWGAPLGTLTGAELADAWLTVDDKTEASKLVKEAMSSVKDRPADSAEA